jgi:hypothetical protein
MQVELAGAQETPRWKRPFRWRPTNHYLWRMVESLLLFLMETYLYYRFTVLQLVHVDDSSFA